MSSWQYKQKVRGKIDTIIAKAKSIYRHAPGEAFSLAEETLFLAESIRDTPRVVAAHDLAAACLDQLARFEEGIEHCRTAIRLCEEKGEERLLPGVLTTYSYLLSKRGAPAGAIEVLRRALAILERHDDSMQMRITLNALGMFLDVQEEYAEAMDALLRALALWEESGEVTRGKAMVYNNLGASSFGIGDIDRAIHFLSLAIDTSLAANDPLGSGNSMRNLAAILFRSGRPGEGLLHAEESVRLLGSVNAGPRVAQALATLGDILRALGREDEAAASYGRAIEIAEATGTIDLLIDLHQSLISLHAAAGEIAIAISRCENAIVLAERRQLWKSVMALHQTASDLYERCGRHREALEYHRRYAEIGEEVLDIEKQRAVIEVKTKYEADMLERENELQRLQIEQLRREVELRDRELAVQAMQIVQRSEYLSRLEREMTVSQDGEQAPSTAIQRLRAELTSDSDWESFMQRFRQVHPEFESKIAERFPTLTPAELRVCVLTRIGLSTKEIAGLLYASVRTIQNQRGSIRKKLAIMTETAFATFLTGL